MKHYQIRVVEEHRELHDKLTKLSAFVKSDLFQTVEQPEQLRLSLQLGFMQSYCDVLAERIAAFV